MRWLRHDICGWLGGILMLTLLAGPANAAPPSTETEASAVSVGQSLIDAGDAARERGGHGEAIALWNQAYDKLPSTAEYASLRQSILSRIIAVQLTMYVGQPSGSRTAKEINDVCALLLALDRPIYEFESRLALAQCDAMMSAEQRESEAAETAVVAAEPVVVAAESNGSVAKLSVQLTRSKRRHYYLGGQWTASSDVALLTTLGYRDRANGLRGQRKKSAILLTLGSITLIAAGVFPIAVVGSPNLSDDPAGFIVGGTLVATGGLGLLMGGVLMPRRMSWREVENFINDYNGEGQSPSSSHTIRRPSIALSPRHHGASISLAFSF